MRAVISRAINQPTLEHTHRCRLHSTVGLTPSATRHLHHTTGRRRGEKIFFFIGLSINNNNSNDDDNKNNENNENNDIINDNNNISRSSYPAFSSPAAFVPHSAINLSVKTNEEGQHSAEPSPQILDLTRPLRYT